MGGRDLRTAFEEAIMATIGKPSEGILADNMKEKREQIVEMLKEAYFAELETAINYMTHVLHLYNHQFKPLWTELREAFSIEHEMQQTNIEESIEDAFCRFEQRQGLLSQATL